MRCGLEVLRDATRGLHEAVERTPTMAAMMGPGVDRHAYVAYLRAIAAAIAPLARHLAPPPGAVAAPPAATWALLEDDLRRLDATRPPPRTPPPLEGEAGAWGRLYVVRGAEAGLAMLAAMLERHPAAAAWPRRFLADARARRGDWPGLLRALERLDPALLEAAATGARRDFAFALEAIRSLEHASVGGPA